MTTSTKKILTTIGWVALIAPEVIALAIWVSWPFMLIFGVNADMVWKLFCGAGLFSLLWALPVGMATGVALACSDAEEETKIIVWLPYKKE